MTADIKDQLAFVRSLLEDADNPVKSWRARQTWLLMASRICREVADSIKEEEPDG